MNKIKKNKPSIMLILYISLMSVVSISAHAGGVALGSTRIIYPQGNQQVSLPIANSDEKEVFLIQSWVANADGSKSNDFIVTPPLFVIQPKKENILRIIYTGAGNLPTDRETLYYLNTKAIPAVDKKNLNGNTLQIASQSVIKLFVRPKGLPTSSIDSPKTLRCQLNNGLLTVTNPSPYYITLVQLTIGNHKLKNLMVPPKGDNTVPVPANILGALTFQTINDYGANTSTQTCAI